MKLKFTKMQGAGNDFVVIDSISQSIDFTPDQWRAFADRHFGVGADQLLLVERSTQPGVDFRYRIFNADGGEVEHCGNGARCFVKFVRDTGLTDKRTVRVEVQQGLITLTMRDDGQVSVDMGAPILTASDVPFDASGLAGRREGDDTLWPLDVAGKTTWISVVSMGNPHAVQVVENVDTAPVETDGPVIERHARFPRRVNAGFLQVVDKHQARLRVYE
ncbi:MAG: diaminopimelate epimerase, partial [Pandoraea sp.]|nr:diaminopimelate epimerase [Pandoraea sp.]